MGDLPVGWLHTCERWRLVGLEVWRGLHLEWIHLLMRIQHPLCRRLWHTLPDMWPSYHHHDYHDDSSSNNSSTVHNPIHWGAYNYTHHQCHNLYSEGFIDLGH